MAGYLTAQAAAGPAALMLFESWAGLLAAGVRALRARRRPPHRRARLRHRRAHLLRQLRCIADGRGPGPDVDVVGVDWRTGLAEVRQTLGAAKAAGEIWTSGAVRPARGTRVTSMRCCGRPERRRGISSISAMASGRRPTRMPSRAWSTTSMSTASPGDRAASATAYFRDLQERLCRAFEAFEPAQRFERRAWTKPEGHRLEGGGESRLLRGAVFEKVGVNVSHVWGTLAPGRARPGGRRRGFRRALRRLRHLPGGAHGQPLRAGGAPEPALPRHQPRLVRGRLRTLTPAFPSRRTPATFTALRVACEGYRPDAYAGVQEPECDRYFYLPHRQGSPRRGRDFLRRAGECRRSGGFRVRACGGRGAA